MMIGDGMRLEMSENEKEDGKNHKEREKANNSPMFERAIEQQMLHELTTSTHINTQHTRWSFEGMLIEVEENEEEQADDDEALSLYNPLKGCL